MERIKNLHGHSYETFWCERFPTLLKRFLDDLIAEQGDRLGFSGPTQVVEITRMDDFAVSEAVSYCRERGLDLTQSIKVRIKLDSYGATHDLYLGQIPKETLDGGFILNGKERFILAQLIASPGLFFSKETTEVKYRCKGEYFDIEWTVYKADLIPSEGIWLEFKLRKLSPGQKISKLPFDLQDRIVKLDGKINVRLRRKHRFPIDHLLFALGLIDVRLPDAADEDEWALPADEAEKEYGVIRRSWTEIAQCLGIQIQDSTDDDIKACVRERLLNENRLSLLARYQINRRLKRLGLPGDSNADHVTLEDINGILTYLRELSGGKALPLDSRRSLANKRVRLLGDIMEEEVLPNLFWKIRKGIKRRVDEKNKDSGRIQEEEWIQIVRQECSAGEKFLKNIKEFLTSSELSALGSDENALEKESLRRRITLFGPRGLPSTHVKDVRDIHWSHYGRLCPVDTPQSDRLGATLSVPLEARVNPMGLLETPVYEIAHDNGRTVVTSTLQWLSAADEEDQQCWIAYHDQLEPLKGGQKVWARKGDVELRNVDASQVRYVDAYPLQQFSLAPRLIPFLQHNDANRVLMACSAMRQALPLAVKEPPLISTGYENVLANGNGGPWAYGRNLLVAYMPYHGLNFEDAIVVSESAAEKLSAIRQYQYEIGLREYLVIETTAKTSKNGKHKEVRKIVRWETTRDIPRPKRSCQKLDHNGIVKLGAWVEPGDVLVGVVDPQQKQTVSVKTLAARAIEGKKVSPWDHSLTMPKGERGKVTEVRIFSIDEGDILPCGIWKLIRVTVQIERTLQVGDKLANRHGGKGVVSAVIKDEDMPRYMDKTSSHNHDDIGPHTHVEIIMNPLGVISRLNLGQLYEAHLGWIASRVKPGGYVVQTFSNSLALLNDEKRKTSDILAQGGAVRLHDPLTRKDLERSVTVGYAYILRLHHLAGEKVHGRGYGRQKYATVSEQPLKGKKKEGGQRIGEMEIWGLEAYNARQIIQEVLTLKSDNPRMREWLHQSQTKASVTGNVTPEPPEMLKVLAVFLLCLGLKLDFKDKNGKSLCLVGPKAVDSPQKVHSVSILPLQEGEARALSSGEVTDSRIGLEGEGYEDGGLFSQTIFGPVVDWVCKCGTFHAFRAGETERCKKCKVEIAKRETRRYRLGHIELPYPVFNVVFLDVTCRLLGLSRLAMKNILMENSDAPIFRFSEPLDFLLFIWLGLNGSRELKNRIEKRLEYSFRDCDLTFKGVRSLFQGPWVNYLNALPSKELMEGISSIELLGEILKTLTRERLKEMREALYSELSKLVECKVREDRQRQLRNRLEVVDLFLHSDVPPSAMMIQTLLVLPPDLRQPYALPTGKTIRGELNELYQDVLYCTQSIKEGMRKARDLKGNIRALQQKVSALVDNDRAYPPSYDEARGKRYHQSLAHFLKGKKGFFRANLLGKRVDYSGRAVIVPDPWLNLNQCGLPYPMAVEIFKPILIARLRDLWRPQGKKKRNAVLSDRAIEGRINKTLEESKGSQVGDEESQNKRQVVSVLEEFGAQYPVLMNRQPTLHRLGIQAFHFKVNPHDAVSMHPLVTAGFNADFDGDTIAIYRLITQGALDEAKRLMAGNNLFSPANGSVTLNLGQDVALGGYLQTLTPEGKEELKCVAGGFEVDSHPLDGGALRRYLRGPLRYYNVDNVDQACNVVDDIKWLCFDKATEAGITLSIFDMPDLSLDRDALRTCKDAEAKIEVKVRSILMANPQSPLGLIHFSGAKGDIRTIRQLVAMRGKMERVADKDSKGVELDVWSSLREGMTQGEYFVSCYGSRTTLVDKKMGTADAGYITRQLVEMTHRYRITEEDCVGKGDAQLEGLEIGPNRDAWLDIRDWGKNTLIEKLREKHILTLLWDVSNKKGPSPYLFEKVNKDFNSTLEEKIREWDPQKRLLGAKFLKERDLEELKQKLYGRVLLRPVEIEGKIINGYLVESEDAALELATSIKENERPVLVRSPLTCRSSRGICMKCYGLDLSTGKLPEIGAKVGIIAAQSIGEPGTQLVLRTFHHGGVVGMAGISKDIPKVQRFLHANALVQLVAKQEGLGISTYPLLLDGIKEIYLNNGAQVSDQHFEVLLKAMLSKVEVVSDTNHRYFPGQVMAKEEWERLNPKPEVRPIISGINVLTRHPASWLSSASFGGVITALAYAAIGKREDNLLGLKENVILGRLFP